MAITNDDIEKLAELARIEISKDEQKELLDDMQEILGFVDHIAEVATEEKKVMPGDHRNIMRDDGNAYKRGAYTEDILKEAPKKENGFVQTKKIL